MKNHKTTKSNAQVCEFNVDGMHCAACELVIEKKFSKVDGVNKVDAVLSDGKVYVELDADLDPIEMREQLSKMIEPDGYKLVETKSEIHNVDWGEVALGGLVAFLLVAIFIIIQQLGILNVGSSGEITLPLVFLIGIVASMSSCLAVVGGLVLSISSTYAKEGKVKPLIMFHLARLIGFFVLGGVIGLLGNAFILTPAISFVMNLVLFFVMFIMAMNLLNIFPVFQKFQLSMPKFLGRGVLGIGESQSWFTPMILGVATFVLPCGFTQSMQIYSLTTGSFIEGALVMLVFALGTFPVLALISFASVQMSKTLQSGLFFKAAGFIVLFFAFFNFISAMVAVGLIRPIFNI